MNSSKETISKRTLVFRYVILTVMTLGLTALVISSFWYVYSWKNYIYYHPGLWLNINSDGDWTDLPKIRNTGLLIVTKIDSPSAAAKAGIQCGDTLVGINGIKLKDKPNSYFSAFAGAEPGKEIHLEFLKNGIIVYKKLVLERNYHVDLPKGYLGVTSGWTSPDTTQKSKLPQQAQYIYNVDPGMPADSAGIKPGDIILRFDRVQLSNAFHFSYLIDATPPGRLIELEILRKDSVFTLHVKAGSKDPHSKSIAVVRVSGSVQYMVWAYYFPWTLILILLLFVGVPIGLIKPRVTIAFECSVMFLCYGAAIYDVPPFSAALPEWVMVVFICFSNLSTGIALPLTLRVFSVFPNTSRIGKLFLKWQMVIFCLYILAVLWGSAGLFAYYYSWNVSWPWLYLILENQGWIYAPFVILLIALLVSQRIETRTKPQERLKIIELGMLLGIISMVFIVVALLGFLPESWGRGFGSVILYVLVVTFSCIPLSFAYAVLSRKVFGIKFIIRKGLRYLLLSKGALIVEGIIVFFIVIQILSYAGTEFLNSPTAVGGVAVASTLAVIAFVGRVNRKLMPSIDRRFFREVLDVQKLLLDLNQQLSAIREREQILQQTANTVLRALHPARVVMLLKHGKSDEFRCALTLENERAKPTTPSPTRHSEPCPDPDEVGRRIDSESNPSRSAQTLKQVQGDAGVVCMLKTDDTIIKQMEEKKGWVIVNRETLDLEKDEDKRLSAVNCELFIGLRGSSGLIGVMGLGDKLSEEPYSKEDRELLLTVAHEMGMALENAELLEVAKREAEFSKELDIARQVQQNLFPKQLPTPSGWEFAGICEPAKAVGGDYYDIFEAISGKVVIALGDVSGKGLGASFVMSGVHSTIRTNTEKSIDNPVGLINELNKYLLGSTSKNIFVTLFLGIINLETGQMQYVNCGHPPAFIVRKENSEIEKLTRTGLALGMMNTVQFIQGTSTLNVGDSLIVYSDGITEAMNSREEMYEEERLTQLLTTTRGLDSSHMMEAILKSVSEFIGQTEQSDDVSIIVARRILETA